ncbi:MAG: hypothetical protein V9G12_25140 [Microthrixaceae bacterium]
MVRPQRHEGPYEFDAGSIGFGELEGGGEVVDDGRVGVTGGGDDEVAALETEVGLSSHGPGVVGNLGDEIDGASELVAAGLERAAVA